MAEIVWTLVAAQWLEEISQYIASESASSAPKVVTGSYDKIQLLRTHPRLGQHYEPIADRERHTDLSLRRRPPLAEPARATQALPFHCRTYTSLLPALPSTQAA